MIIQPRVRLMIRQIAEETGLSFNQIKDIALSSQYKFLVENINAGVIGEPDTFKNIIIRYIGTWQSSPGKIYYMTKKRKEMLERGEENA